MKLFPEADKHLYILCSLILLIAAVAVMALDNNVSRAFSVSGCILNLAGAYWIASGVVLRSNDLTSLQRTIKSGGTEYYGIDPNKKVIPDMLKIQSRRAQFGICCIFIGSISQIIASYTA